MKLVWNLLLSKNSIIGLSKMSRVNISQKAIIAVCQMTATENKDANLKVCKDLITSAKKFNAQVIFLPEACDYVGKNKPQTIEMAEDVNGPTLSAYKELAKQHNVWLSLGGIHIKVDDKTVRNAHVLLNSNGEIEADYSKLHLFDVDYKEGNVHLKESSYCKPGTKLLPPVSTPAGNIGLSICYDLRFPEASVSLRMQGADILTYPSAFTFATGAAHWEPLLRARAIETQCYVVAAAQSGMHNEKRTSWGHAMIVDPWGAIVAQCSEGNNVAVAEVDHELLRKTRLSMPVLEHRRNDVYPSLKVHCVSQPQEDTESKQFQFGQVYVKGSGIFAQTHSSMAFTNKKCVVPGHVLVSPLRCVQRMSQLNPEEVADLFMLVHKVAPIIEKAFKGTSSTIVVQDGKDSGQTIEHVHVHILPRRPGDYLNNDDIYRDLAKHDKDDSTGRWRTEEEMAAEAKTLRPYFT
ncbi:nitrilase and fragile histidine triad fusion protein NitFhit [Frankliniella occidentalis]|uniref:Nitrilase and fragile histidine triad fusion protein NitFhit n=1 Tax=Frankliniella occidentalis TaxID=133901 RepID=A0A6J1T7X9_FRAOC|nr:nitrilase and fragile histidine triad fusion protein NitFhit [Frankliniella occidentalis]XP_026289384.1 nitrilase and fragile histidine triad fusion protein NitFhit [Frankliniella occidentalis]